MSSIAFSAIPFHFLTRSVFLLSFIPGVVSAQVLPDGVSATGVTIASDGLVTVDIAPADTAAISHNTYSAFSVPAAGVDLNNSSAGAATIINEVTSSNISEINGRLRVTGQDADVIIANPNGITVNGGRFVTTGNVGLVTGAIDRSSGGVEANVVSGAIDIDGAGLSGTMQELALISRQLRVDGPLTYDTATAASRLNIIAGAGQVDFDRDRGGLGQDGAGLLPWARHNGGGQVLDAVIVDITGNGSLSAGRINITVNDAGAGVRFAGDQLAAAGEFRLTSSGQLEIAGAETRSSDTVIIRAAEVDINSVDDRQGAIVSEGSGVVIRAEQGDIDLGDGHVQGARTATDTFASLGAVTLSASGDIVSQGTETFFARLTADGGDAEGRIRNSHIVLNSGGRIHLEGLNASASDDIRLIAGQELAFSESSANAGRDFTGFAVDSAEFDAAQITAKDNLTIRGAMLRFGADDALQARTELLAETGGLVLRSVDGDILNYGSLLQGRSLNGADADSRGGASVYAAGNYLNKSLSVERLAVLFGEQDALYLEAGGNVTNDTARLFSNGDITIEAGGDLINQTSFTAEADPFTIETYRGKRFASSLFLRRSRVVRAYADFGDQLITGEQSFILGAGDVSLTAQNVLNDGADITGTSLNIEATGKIENFARQTGTVSFTQTCKWFCRTSGYSDLRSVGGNISATETAHLQAGDEVRSLAGNIRGDGALTITAPLTTLIPALSASLITHPGGLFGGRPGYLNARYEYGTLQSFSGAITINGDADLGGANVFSPEDIVITGTRIETELPIAPAPFEQRPIGLFWNLF